MNFKTYFDDLEYLKNKYHNTDEPFDSFNRMAHHGYKYDESTGMSDDEIRDGLDKLTESIKDEPHSVIKAKAFEYVLNNTKIDANEHDYFIGIWSWNRLIHKFTINKWLGQVRNEILPDTYDTLNKLQSTGAFEGWMDYDHSVPDWEALFRLGFKGIKDRAKKIKENHLKQGSLTKEEAALFESIDIEYNAIINLILRIADYSDRLNHSKSKKISKCLRNIASNPPCDTYEVLQLIYIYFMTSESVDCYQVRSLASGFDRMIYPYYKKDIESGKYTEDELDELIAYFLTQWSAIGNYWGQPLYIGGTYVDGNSTVNPLSYKFIDIYDYINIYNPKIQVKFNMNTPPDFTEKVLSMIQKGKTSFVIMCEPGIYRAMRSLGVTHREAIECDVKGCYEFSVKGKEVSTAPIYLNLLSPIVYTLYNNAYPINGDYIRNDEIKTFEDFYNIYKEKLGLIIDNLITNFNEIEKYLSFVNPSPMFTATIEDALISKKDAYFNGMKYNNSVLFCSGFASAVDSLCALKHFVFDTKEYTLNDFKTILDSDWNDNPNLRYKALKLKDKFGNGSEFADNLAGDLSEFIASKECKIPNSRGGIYKSSMHSARAFIKLGKLTPATPDGRKSGEEMSKNASPVQGADRNGVTSLIKSALSMKPYLYTEDYCLDVMLHPSAVAGREGLEALKSVIKTYMENDGISIHFNIFDAEILKDAQKYPDKYNNLQVRVCGWNVLWNDMCKEEQDMYILRAQNIVGV